MVCGSINAGVDNMCNCCGCFASCCCPAGKEQCCDFCNHCFCMGPSCMECCPCGADGCIGYPNHLCGCCGNCNLMWYSSCCPSCFVADLYIATNTENDKAAAWSNIVCTCVTLTVAASILDYIGQLGELDDSSAMKALRLLRIVSGIVELILGIYVSVIFGYSATKIAQAKGLSYEPGQCCTGCYENGCMSTCGTCCSSFNCCCAYSCCYEEHFMQVARTLENDQDMQNAIMQGRPQQCQCCNCWQTAVPLELTTGSSRTGTDAV